MLHISAWHITLLLVLHILISLTLFIILVSTIVFFLRKPMRRFKWIDLAIFGVLHLLKRKSFTRIMLLVTQLGKHQFLIPANILLIFYFIFFKRQSWFSISVAAIALSSLVLMLTLKKLFRRKRPGSPLLKPVRGLSFPSGHAIFAVTFFGLIIHIIRVVRPFGENIWIILLVILIIAIGFSRIYLRVHYASDVLSGFVIGIAWLMISLAVLEKVQKILNMQGEISALNIQSGRIYAAFHSNGR
jgi:membrane-associated phospholipid phosphatase